MYIRSGVFGIQFLAVEPPSPLFSAQPSLAPTHTPTQRYWKCWLPNTSLRTRTCWRVEPSCCCAYARLPISALCTLGRNPSLHRAYPTSHRGVRSASCAERWLARTRKIGGKRSGTIAYTIHGSTLIYSALKPDMRCSRAKVRRHASPTIGRIADARSDRP